MIRVAFLFETVPHNRSLELSVRRILQKAATHIQLKAADITVTVTTDAHIKRLNSIYRGKRIPTDVLSFAMRESVGFPQTPRTREYLGDIILNADEVRRRSKKLHVPHQTIFKFLAVHGFLHLAGFDHQRISDEQRMRGLEQLICNGKVFYDSK